jgi:hypothetical protein
MTSKRTIIELSEVSVDAPLADGARAWVHQLAVFSTYEKAESLVRERITKDEDSGGIRYYVLAERTLDVTRLDDLGDTTILGADGAVRGLIHGAYETPWGGRDPETCRFKPGQLVGFVGHVYRVGVVLGLPPSPAEAHRLSGITIGDDCVLIGLLSADGSPETSDHEHPHEAYLFSVEHELPEERRAALARRFEAYAR